MKPIPIVLDTDIGDDIDDALALAVILNSPEFDLRGVTTVFRNAPRRVALVRKMLEVWERSDVPVAAGCSKPLLEPFDARLGTQFEILDGSESTLSDGHGVDFLVEALEQSDESEKLVLAPIGPLTNIALAFARATELAAKSEVVLMGGYWNKGTPGHYPEWNIRCDPEAAEMVFCSGANIKMVGLDVTLRCQLEAKHVQQIASHSSQRAALLSRLITLWTQGYGKPPILHDPLAVLAIIDECVTFEPMRIGVELCAENSGGIERGVTKVLSGEPNALVAVDVDVPRAIELFMARVLD
jgi:inosine-uridine nucleoside N-ribohydrolase